MGVNMQHSIYFDMDGVLARYELAVKKITGKTTTELDAMPKQEKYNFLNPYKVDGLYKKILQSNQIHAMVELMQMLRAMGHRVYILSATGISHHEIVKRDKIDWLKRNVDFDFDGEFFTKTSKEKANFSNALSVLIDDRLVSLEPWRKCGGIGIQYHCEARGDFVKLLDQLTEKGIL